MAETQSAPSLRELSEAASSGHGKNDLWFTNDTTPWILGPEADGETDRFHVVARMPAIRRVDTDARRQWLRDRMFIVALVNAFRAGRLIDPTTLTEAVAAARAEGWQPIETAPRDGTDILIAGGCFDYTGYTFPNPQPMKGCKISSWQKDCWWMEYGEEFDEYYFALPTYWQPLPAPPTLTPGGRTDGGR